MGALSLVGISDLLLARGVHIGVLVFTKARICSRCPIVRDSVNFNDFCDNCHFNNFHSCL